MNKHDKTKLMKVFDNICKNNQYVQHYKGCRIVSYNDPENENLILQFHHRCNDYSYSHTFILFDVYHHVDVELFKHYYNLSLKFFRDTIQDYINSELEL